MTRANAKDVMIALMGPSYEHFCRQAGWSIAANEPRGYGTVFIPPRMPTPDANGKVSELAEYRYLVMCCVLADEYDPY